MFIDDCIQCGSKNVWDCQKHIGENYSITCTCTNNGTDSVYENVKLDNVFDFEKGADCASTGSPGTIMHYKSLGCLLTENQFKIDAVNSGLGFKCTTYESHGGLNLCHFSFPQNEKSDEAIHKSGVIPVQNSWKFRNEKNKEAYTRNYPNGARSNVCLPKNSNNQHVSLGPQVHKDQQMTIKSSIGHVKENLDNKHALDINDRLATKKISGGADKTLQARPPAKFGPILLSDTMEITDPMPGINIGDDSIIDLNQAFHKPSSSDIHNSLRNYDKIFVKSDKIDLHHKSSTLGEKSSKEHFEHAENAVHSLTFDLFIFFFLFFSVLFFVKIWPQLKELRRYLRNRKYRKLK